MVLLCDESFARIAHIGWCVCLKHTRLNAFCWNLKCLSKILMDREPSDLRKETPRNGIGHHLFRGSFLSHKQFCNTGDIYFLAFTITQVAYPHPSTLFSHPTSRYPQNASKVPCPSPPVTVPAPNPPVTVPAQPSRSNAVPRSSPSPGLSPSPRPLGLPEAGLDPRPGCLRWSRGGLNRGRKLAVGRTPRQWCQGCGTTEGYGQNYLGFLTFW